jgi:hypothetical protein
MRFEDCQIVSRFRVFRTDLRVNVRRCCARHFVSSRMFNGWIAHDPQHVFERGFAGCLSSLYEFRARHCFCEGGIVAGARLATACFFPLAIYLPSNLEIPIANVTLNKSSFGHSACAPNSRSAAVTACGSRRLSDFNQPRVINRSTADGAISKRMQTLPCLDRSRRRRIRVADKLGGRALRVIFHLLKVRRLRGPLRGARRVGRQSPPGRPAAAWLKTKNPKTPAGHARCRRNLLTPFPIIVFSSSFSLRKSRSNYPYKLLKPVSGPRPDYNLSVSW